MSTKITFKSYQCKLKQKMKNLKDYLFLSLNKWTSELEPRLKLHALLLPKEIQESANRITSCYICGQATISSNTDKIYAMGMAIKKKMGIDPNEKKKHTSKRLKSGSKREIK